METTFKEKKTNKKKTKKQGSLYRKEIQKSSQNNFLIEIRML